MRSRERRFETRLWLLAAGAMVATKLVLLIPPRADDLRRAAEFFPTERIAAHQQFMAMVFFIHLLTYANLAAVAFVFLSRPFQGFIERIAAGRWLLEALLTVTLVNAVWATVTHLGNSAILDRSWTESIPWLRTAQGLAVLWLIWRFPSWWFVPVAALAMGVTVYDVEQT